MAWVVAAVSVLCTLVVGGVVLVLRRMLRLRREPGTFRCKIRITAGSSLGFKTTWPKLVTRAAWASDVLIVFPRPAAVRMHALAVESAHGFVHTLPRHEVSRLGPDPQALNLILDDGRRLEVAVSSQSRTLLCGPYLVPQAMPNRPNRESRKSD